MASILDRIKQNRAKIMEEGKKSFASSKGFDSPFYYPKVNEKRNASVVIRLLPSKEEDQIPYVKLFKHFFKGDDGSWLSTDLCGTSIGERCPICECNSKLWNSGDPSLVDVAKQRKRRVKHICNIYVIKDPESPEKEGKVFPFEFGPEIHRIIANEISPAFEDEENSFPFDLWDGSDFNLKVTWQPEKKMPTYANSKFINRGSAFLGGDEKAMEKAMSECGSLEQWLDPSKGKSYDDLLRACGSAYMSCLDIAMDLSPSSPRKPKRGESAPPAGKILPAPPLPSDSDLPQGGDEDDEIEYLRKIAAD